MTKIFSKYWDSIVTRPWVGSYFGAFILWLVIVLLAGRGFWESIQSVLILTPFLVLVGIGQMMVITLGNGNFDVSVSYVMSFAAFLALGFGYASGLSIAMSILLTLCIGIIIGIVNVTCILLFRIQPIVATLSTGMIVSTAALVLSEQVKASGNIPLHSFTTAKIASFPVLALIGILIAIIVGIVLERTPYGRLVHAIGQNIEAARHSGLPVRAVIITTYIISAILASFAGLLLGAYTTPSVGLGDPYLLDSIAVVVIGGTLLSGGRSYVAGIWGGALFLTLLEALVNLLHISMAYQNILEGALVILVVSLIKNPMISRDI
jgi:ribose transport system permease protein